MLRLLCKMLIYVFLVPFTWHYARFAYTYFNILKFFVTDIAFSPLMKRVEIVSPSRNTNNFNIIINFNSHQQNFNSQTKSCRLVQLASFHFAEFVYKRAQASFPPLLFGSPRFQLKYFWSLPSTLIKRPSCRLKTRKKSVTESDGTKQIGENFARVGAYLTTEVLIMFLNCHISPSLHLGTPCTWASTNFNLPLIYHLCTWYKRNLINIFVWQKYYLERCVNYMFDVPSESPSSGISWGTPRLGSESILWYICCWLYANHAGMGLKNKLS